MLSWLGRLGAVVAGVTAGLLAGGQLVEPLVVISGSPSVEQGVLHLEPGDLVAVGQGKTLSATGTSEGIDLVLGEPDGRHVVGHVGSVSGLFDDQLSPLGQEPPHPFVPQPGEHTWTLDCQPPVRLVVDRTPLGTGEPVAGCGAQPAALGAAGPTAVTTVTLDGQVVPLASTSFDPQRAATVALILLVLGVLVGAEGQALLLAAPLSLLGPRFGLPGEAVLALFVGAAMVQQAMTARSWRRLVSGVAALASLPLAVAGLQLVVDQPGEQAWDADRPVTALIDLDVVTRKVGIAEQRARKLLQTRDGRPLVVALGSSSTGGDGRQTYWPATVQAERPDLQVLNFAQGGATSWHMRQLLERLDLRPDACLFYMGHNDSMPGFPGITIRGLETGADASGGWVAPVPLEDARDNVAAIAQRCGSTLVMAEYVQGQEPMMAAYGQALADVPGVTVVDAAAVLAALPARSAMIDTVHPSPQGHVVLGRFVAGELSALLPD